jgi:predicted glycogen debranching enzyme
VTKVQERAEYAGRGRALSTDRWADGTIDPRGHVECERFHLDGTTPVWTYALDDALLEKRVWLAPGANTTYVRYHLRRASAPLALTLTVLVNHRDFHGTTHAGDWRMQVSPVRGGARVVAFEGARPLLVLATADGSPPDVQVAHTWYRDFALTAERARGLDWREDHLHAATVAALLQPGGELTLILSAETAPALDVDNAWSRRAAHDAAVVTRWEQARGEAADAPPWIRPLVLAADQFLVARPLRDDPDGATVIAGYPWFGDWGRDTMIALPGLTLTTGRPEIAARVLRTFARFVDGGMLPNRFSEGGDAPEYNTVDAALWYVEAVRAYHAATGDDGLLKELFPTLDGIVRRHVEGTRYGIRVDPADGLLRAGAPGMQLTWMDARAGDRVITPRTGKPVEINALWYNALMAMAGFARGLRVPAERWERLAARARAGFDRYWNGTTGCCYDVIDGPDGHDGAVRPNQIFAVSLAHSALSVERQRGVVEACARHLLVSYGLRTLAPSDAAYCRSYDGDALTRDRAYHQGTAWGWLLGPFALAHFRCHGDRDAARAFLTPMAHHLEDYGVGSIAELFDADPPFTPRGCIAQAWSVAETLRAWHDLAPTR